MRLADAGTISKGYCGLATGNATSRKIPAALVAPAITDRAEVAPSPAMISRRLSSLSRKNWRRLNVVVARLLRAPFVRRAIRSQLAVNREFLFGFVPFAGAAISYRQIVVRRWVAFLKACRHL